MGDRGQLRPQKRAIFFVFDGGTGIGHLRRLSSIAKALQGPFSCLIVTSHRAAAAWFVPPECEYVHLPAWDSLLPEKASYWGRQPYLSVDAGEALDLRRNLLQGIVDSFKPDVMFVDHLPLGMRDELEPIVAGAQCLKYLVTRGVQNETENLAELLLAGKARDSIKRHYDRVFLAIDQRVFDFGKRYRAFDEVAGKLCPVGYVIEPIASDAIAECRRARGLGAGDFWAVASAGGGQLGEGLIAACCELARTHKEFAFDIVIGPRSRLPRESLTACAAANPKLRLHDDAPDLSSWHSAADIVISSGGYNSLLESLRGTARIICVPNRKSERDEQYAHAACLRRFATIDLDLDPGRLPAMFEEAAAALRKGPNVDRRAELDFAGAAAIRRIALADSGLESDEPAPR
ncbi:MAG TPA: glycosyltransferase [Allosphingosinicella sp.]|nr:glycosyltransferase [Allosphingosinicella sp.]